MYHLTSLYLAFSHIYFHSPVSMIVQIVAYFVLNIVVLVFLWPKCRLRKWSLPPFQRYSIVRPSNGHPSDTSSLFSGKYTLFKKRKRRKSDKSKTILTVCDSDRAYGHVTVESIIPVTGKFRQICWIHFRTTAKANNEMTKGNYFIQTHSSRIKITYVHISLSEGSEYFPTEDTTQNLFWEHRLNYKVNQRLLVSFKKRAAVSEVWTEYISMRMFLYLIQKTCPYIPTSVSVRAQHLKLPLLSLLFKCVDNHDSINSKKKKKIWAKPVTHPPNYRAGLGLTLSKKTHKARCPYLHHCFASETDTKADITEENQILTIAVQCN